jgi:ABC-type glycerol-3-phosphate transport system permease component
MRIMAMSTVTRTLQRNFRLSTFLVNLSLFVIVIICLVPFIWSVSSSLKGREELFQTMPSLLPKNPR